MGQINIYQSLRKFIGRIFELFVKCQSFGGIDIFSTGHGLQDRRTLGTGQDTEGHRWTQEDNLKWRQHVVSV